MSLIFWVIIGIIIGSFILTTLWIFFNFLKNIKRDFTLYKSVYKSVFSRKLSLSIIVIFYLISFGLVGGLTSIIGKLNNEVSSYIKDNHLHQGVTRQTTFNETTSSEDIFGQKSFYLATQGVIDFYSDYQSYQIDKNLNNNQKQNCPTETNFIDMLGGQEIDNDNGKVIEDGNPTLKERLNGSTSPLSISSNNYDASIYNTYSIQDVGSFWNTWYVGPSSFKQNSAWLNYGYNGNEEQCAYEISEAHNDIDEGIISKIETIYSEFIYFDDWTFDYAIEKNVTDDLDTFSDVVFTFFDNDINKYFSTIGTFFFEYYLDLYYDNNNLFASSDVYEYQQSFHGADFLLQSYNKNQVNNKKTLINNPGEDKNGKYAIDTMKFYDDKGKEISGPNPAEINDEFFKPHDGTVADPYQIYVSKEYYDDKNLADKKNKTSNIFINQKIIYYQVQGSYRSPTYSFPMQTVSNGFQNPADNATILINTQSLLRLTRSPSISTTNYEFFGFSNVYDETKKATDWYYSESKYEKGKPSSTYPEQVTTYITFINSFYGDDGLDDDNLVANGWEKNEPQAFYLNGETLSSKNSLISLRSYAIIQQIHGDKIFFAVVMAIFLFITIIVLILLIKKRISDSNKQMGTIKALGFNPSRIASAYTIFPIIIIILGGILAIMVAIPLSFFFASLYGSFYSINLSGVYVGLMLWLKVFIFPLILSMFIGYWMAYRTIKEPTLDLLNNVNKDKPNFLVRGTSYLIPSFASFGFTYKLKGIGRASLKSLLLFFAIMGSMSITSFAFASSTMTSTMTKEVFDVINYDSKTWEFGAPFIENININDVGENYDNLNGEQKMEAFDLFSQGTNSKNSKINYETLSEYILAILWSPNYALDTFQDLLIPIYPFDEQFDFTFEISDYANGSPKVSANYYIDWKSAVALWATNIALHVSTSGINDENNDGINDDLTEPIYEEVKDGITFQMLDPLLSDYTVDIGANIVTRYGTKVTFSFLNFFNKIIADYTEGNRGELLADFRIIVDWIKTYNITEYIFLALKNEYIFSDIVFNKNYYDGPDEENQIDQTITTSFYSYLFKTDLRGNLIWDDDQEKFESTSFYMEGYTSIDELLVTNEIGSSAENHIRNSEYEGDEKRSKTNNVVNVAMTEAQFKEMQRYKKATPKLNKDLSSNSKQARVLANTKVWDADTNSYQTAYVPVILDVEIYQSIFPLGVFFLQEDMDDAINYSLSYISNLHKKDAFSFFGYNDFLNSQYDLIDGNAFYEPDYSVTYNIDNYDTFRDENFVTAPFSVSLQANELTTLITENEQLKNEEITVLLETLVNNYYAPFSIPLSIDVIISQGSKVYELIQGIFYIIAFFSLFTGTTIVMIAMKDIIDSNKREVSMFKAFGYSNGKATSLVITPYLFVIVLAFLIAIPVSLTFLLVVGLVLTISTGTTFVFTLALWQWFVVVGFIISLIIFLGFVGYKSYQYTNALKAITETNE